MGWERGKKEEDLDRTGSGPGHHVGLSQLDWGLWGQERIKSGQMVMGFLTPELGGEGTCPLFPGHGCPRSGPPGSKLVFACLLNSPKKRSFSH